MVRAEREEWTTGQVAEHCNIDRHVVHQYKARVPGFPQPIPGRRSGDGQLLFDAAQVRAWQASRRGRGKRRVDPSTKGTA